MRRSSLVTWSIATIAAAAFPNAGPAQDLPREGEFRVFWVFVNPQPFDPIPLGRNREAVVQTFFSSLINQEEGGFLHDARGRCIAFQVIDRTANTIDITGHCDYADRSGDHAYETFSTQGAKPLTAIVLKGEFTGGTGKYEGLTGEEVVTGYGTTRNGEVLQAAGIKVGNYKIVLTN